MDFSQVGTCVAIVVICYLAGIGAKLIPVIKDNQKTVRAFLIYSKVAVELFTSFIFFAE